jgi:hypothetical protein
MTGVAVEEGEGEGVAVEGGKDEGVAEGKGGVGEGASVGVAVGSMVGEGVEGASVGTDGTRVATASERLQASAAKISRVIAMMGRSQGRLIRTLVPTPNSRLFSECSLEYSSTMLASQQFDASTIPVQPATFEV